MKLMPASSARWMIRTESSWSLFPHAPNIIAPRQSGLTVTPVLPSLRCSIATVNDPPPAMGVQGKLGKDAGSVACCSREPPRTQIRRRPARSWEGLADDRALRRGDLVQTTHRRRVGRVLSDRGVLRGLLEDRRDGVGEGVER